MSDIDSVSMAGRYWRYRLYCGLRKINFNRCHVFKRLYLYAYRVIEMKYKFVGDFLRKYDSFFPLKWWTIVFFRKHFTTHWTARNWGRNTSMSVVHPHHLWPQPRLSLAILCIFNIHSSHNCIKCFTTINFTLSSV